VTYLVVPDDRRDKVEQEILRPIFTLREKPLRNVCGFLSFSKLVEKAEGIRKLGIASSLRPTSAHCFLIARTHSGWIGRCPGPLSPPTITSRCLRAVGE